MPKTISKSRYLAGLHCPKRLWLEIHRYDLKDEVDQDTQAVFDQGQAVGELAQLLFPDGQGLTHCPCKVDLSDWL